MNMNKLTPEQKVVLLEQNIIDLKKRINLLEYKVKDNSGAANNSTANSDIEKELQDVKATLSTIGDEQYVIKQEMVHFKENLADNIVATLRDSIFTEKKYMDYNHILEDKLKTIINEYKHDMEQAIASLRADMAEFKLQINKTFVPADEIASIATKEDMKNLTKFIHERYSSIMYQVDDTASKLLDVVKQDDLNTYINSIKEWIMKDYKLSDYVSTKALKKELDKYETKLEAQLTKDTILNSIKHYNLEDYVTKDILNVALNTTPEDLKSIDRIHNLLSDFTTQKDVREITEMLYSRVKTDLENIVATMVSKDTYVNFTNDMANKQNSVVTTVNANGHLIGDYIHKTDDLLVVYNALTKDMNNIYESVNAVKAEYTDEIIELINAKVNEVTTAANSKIMSYGNELASVQNSIRDITPTVVVNIK